MRRFPLSLAALLLSAASVWASAPKEKDFVLAHVGDDTIDSRELKDEFIRRHGGHAKFLGGDSEVRAFLDQVIDRRLLLQESYRLGLDQLPEIVEVVAEHAESKAVEKLVDDETTARARPTEAQIKQAWKTKTTTLYKVQQMVLPTREAAEEVAALLAKGGDFEALARERSVGPSKITGGMIGGIGWGRGDEEWENRVFAMKVNTTSPPFQTEQGWEIVRMLEKKKVEPPPYKKAHEQIKGILEKRMLEARRKAFAQELWTRYHATINPVLDLEAPKLAAVLKSAPETVLATWDGGSLTLEAFAKGLDLEQKTKLTPDQSRAEIEKLLRQTINDPLVRLEAKRRKIAELPELQRETKTFRENLMERALYADYLLKGVELPEADVKAWYDEHQAELATPERRRVAHIVVATKEDAEALRQRLANGEDFAALAKASSTDTQSKNQAGDLGWVTARDTPAEFKPVLALQVGEVSEPLQSKFGWHLVRVNTIEPPKPRTYDEVKDEVRQQLLDNKRTQVRKEWIAKLRDATPITVDDKAIAALVKATDAALREPPPTPASH